MDARTAAAAILPILHAEQEQNLWETIYYLPDGPRRTVLINAWVALDNAETRRHESAARFGRAWPWR